MKNGSILIISNEFSKGEFISDRVKLLRESDNIQIVSYIETISVLNSTQPVIIIVYCENDASIGIVKEMRTLKSLDKTPIILVTDSFDENLLLYAFDNGIDDFFFLNDSESVILMRILLTLQKAMMYKKQEVYEDILAASGIVDKSSGIYTIDQAPIALKHFISQCLEENLDNAVFMCLKPISLTAKKLNMIEIANIIKTVPRGNDIIAFGKNLTFYLILYNSGVNGARNFIFRLKNLLAEKCSIYGNAAEINASFEEMEPVLLQSLKEQISSGIEFNYLNSIETDKIAKSIDIQDEKGKKFKDFKKEFYNNFEKIAAPAFYQMKIQTAEKLPNAVIDFDINENESIFSISQNDIKSEIIITYPAYMKLLIDIKHKFGTKRPQLRRLSYDFEDISQEKLISILEDVKNEFEVKLNKEINEKKSDFKLE